MSWRACVRRRSPMVCCCCMLVGGGGTAVVCWNVGGSWHGIVGMVVVCVLLLCVCCCCVCVCVYVGGPVCVFCCCDDVACSAWLHACMHATWLRHFFFFRLCIFFCVCDNTMCDKTIQVSKSIFIFCVTCDMCVTRYKYPPCVRASIRACPLRTHAQASKQASSLACKCEPGSTI